MTNVEKLKTLGILGDIRERLGSEDEHDTTFDEKINKLDSDDLVEKWCGWHLGNESWWVEMKSIYNQLEALSEEKEDSDKINWDIKKLKKIYDQFLRVPIPENLLKEYYENKQDILQIQDYVGLNKKNIFSELEIKAIVIIDSIETLYCNK